MVYFSTSSSSTSGSTGSSRKIGGTHLLGQDGLLGMVRPVSITTGMRRRGRVGLEDAQRLPAVELGHQQVEQE